LGSKEEAVLGKNWISVAAILAILAFVSACSGSSNGSDNNIFPDVPDQMDVLDEDGTTTGEGTDVKDVPDKDGVDTPDPVDIPEDKDVPSTEVPDEGDDVEEVDTPCQDGCDEDVVDEKPPPMCPCDETLEAWVCGTDGIDYENDMCAACDICQDAPDCVGCTGEKKCDMLNPEGPSGWIEQKAKCEVCICFPDVACENLGMTPPCPAMCGVGPDEVADTEDDVTYAGPCEMMQAYSVGIPACYEDYDEFLNYFGECKEPPCDPCENLPANPVCGEDGQTYKNFCTLSNCPGTTTLAYLGACLDADFCPDCQGDEKTAVCGENGVTYANECAAVTCQAQTVAYPGACCVECANDPVTEVCGDDFMTYPNDCVLMCLLIPKKYDGPCTCDCDMTEAWVCGSDGMSHINECWMTCEGATKLYDGECVGDCPQCPKVFEPVCAGGKTYPSQCFVDCFGVSGTAGVCNGCSDICGTPDNPKPDFGGEACGANGITYPTSCFPEKCHYDGALGSTTGACL